MRYRRDDDRSYRGMENDEGRGRAYDREEDMGGSRWSGASGRGGMREGGFGGAWGGQREHGGFGNYAGGGDPDASRQWGRDRDRYDRDFSGEDYDDRPRNLGARDYETRHFGYPGGFGYGPRGYGGPRHGGYGPYGGGGSTAGRGEGWGRRMGGTDLGFGYGEHEGREPRGPHYGKGPKNYRRSDERIREDVCETIASQGFIDATDVEVKVDEGIVTLTGTVAQRRHKRALEQMTERVRGVDEVHNELRLQREARGEPGREQQQQQQQQQGGMQGRNGRPARA